MAYIQERKDKNGNVISYSIRVFKGYAPNGEQLKPYTATFKPDKNKTARQNEKALNKFVVEFETKCKSGLACDNRQTFAEYAEYVLSLKERSGAKHTTLVRYRDLLKVINENIGFMKLADIRPQHLNNLYELLSKSGTRRTKDKACCKIDFKSYLKEQRLTQKELSEQSGVPCNTMRAVVNGKSVYLSTAEKLCKALDVPVKQLFNVVTDNRPLANKTITEYHRLISTIMAQADKELLIPFNPARKATPPKVKRESVNYFQIEDVERIRNSLEDEPIKFKTMVHLLLITGARRGEILGLKWNCVDWNANRIHICRSILYSSDIGIYEDTTKTEQSDRFITLPLETMELLREYRRWYLLQARMYGDQWHNTGYLFFQEKASNAGKPMHPDTLNDWLSGFSKRYDLLHINPHAFRHTMASILYFNNVDSVSISHRLGHSKISTTTDIYSHIMKEADKQSAECIANVILRPKNKDKQRKAE